jgi:hypothetical protein
VNRGITIEHGGAKRGRVADVSTHNLESQVLDAITLATRAKQTHNPVTAFHKLPYERRANEAVPASDEDLHPVPSRIYSSIDEAGENIDHGIDLFRSVVRIHDEAQPTLSRCDGWEYDGIDVKTGPAQSSRNVPAARLVADMYRKDWRFACQRRETPAGKPGHEVPLIHPETSASLRFVGYDVDRLEHRRRLIGRQCRRESVCRAADA